MEEIERISAFSGLQYPFSTHPALRKQYDAQNVEYATSSHQEDHDMFPGLIALPTSDDDIKQAIKFARENGYPVAVMSGGHQYSGACSTHGKGVQLNLKSTYKNPQTDLLVLPPLPAPNANRPLVYVSVSHSLGEFNDFLGDHQLFVPHGQCTDVHLGGHGQTGGYGQLGRSFGLLGDHIWAIRMIDYQGEIKEVTKGSNPELFYAILGGSPGNFGIITHYTIEVHRDRDHYFPVANDPHEATPRGLKSVWLYNENVLSKLLDEVATMADDLDFPRNFDLCVSVLSSSFPILKLLPELKADWDDILQTIHSLTHKDGDRKWPSSIILFAQWVPMNADDKYTDEVDAWFQKFRDLQKRLEYLWLTGGDLNQPMSMMTKEWLFERPREFDFPYEKRTFMTSSTTLVKDKWVNQVKPQLTKVIAPFPLTELWQKCYLSVQIQCFGGKHSQFYANRDNGTSYSWRDSTVCSTMDCFHEADQEGKTLAAGWQAENDKLMIGPNSPYSKQDKRVLWGSYGDWNMNNSWPFYYEDQAKYERLGKQRYLADPNGTFTPNPFCIKAVRN